MATHPDLDVQEKIYDTLTGDSTLMNLIEDVYDGVPDESDYPYVMIGETEYSDWSGHDFDGFEAETTIHVWSQYRGRSEAKSIQDEIYRLLQNIDLGISGFPTIFFKLSFQRVLPEPDGKTYHGVQRFQFQIGGN